MELVCPHDYVFFFSHVQQPGFRCRIVRDWGLHQPQLAKWGGQRKRGKMCWRRSKKGSVCNNRHVEREDVRGLSDEGKVQNRWNFVFVGLRGYSEWIPKGVIWKIKGFRNILKISKTFCWLDVGGKCEVRDEAQGLLWVDYINVATKLR